MTGVFDTDFSKDSDFFKHGGLKFREAVERRDIPRLRNAFGKADEISKKCFFSALDYLFSEPSKFIFSLFDVVSACQHWKAYLESSFSRRRTVFTKGFFLKDESDFRVFFAKCDFSVFDRMELLLFLFPQRSFRPLTFRAAHARCRLLLVGDEPSEKIRFFLNNPSAISLAALFFRFGDASTFFSFFSGGNPTHFYHSLIAFLKKNNSLFFLSRRETTILFKEFWRNESVFRHLLRSERLASKNRGRRHEIEKLLWFMPYRLSSSLPEVFFGLSTPKALVGAGRLDLVLRYFPNYWKGETSYREIPVALYPSTHDFNVEKKDSRHSNALNLSILKLSEQYIKGPSAFWRRLAAESDKSPVDTLVRLVWKEHCLSMAVEAERGELSDSLASKGERRRRRI